MEEYGLTTTTKGLATLEAFTCFYFLTKLSSNVFLSFQCGQALTIQTGPEPGSKEISSIAATFKNILKPVLRDIFNLLNFARPYHFLYHQLFNRLLCLVSAFIDYAKFIININCLLITTFLSFKDNAFLL